MGKAFLKRNEESKSTLTKARTSPDTCSVPFGTGRESVAILKTEKSTFAISQFYPLNCYFLPSECRSESFFKRIEENMSTKFLIQASSHYDRCKSRETSIWFYYKKYSL